MIVDKVEKKVACLTTRNGLSVKTALIYEGHLAPSVEAVGFFDAIVPIEALFTTSVPPALSPA